MLPPPKGKFPITSWCWVGAGVGVMVGVPGIGVAVGDAVRVGVAVGRAVGTPVAVRVAVEVGAAVTVRVAVAAPVGVRVTVGPAVEVRVAVAVAVPVGVRVAVEVGGGVGQVGGLPVKAETALNHWASSTRVTGSSGRVGGGSVGGPAGAQLVRQSRARAMSSTACARVTGRKGQKLPAAQPCCCTTPSSSHCLMKPARQ